MDALNIYLFI